MPKSTTPINEFISGMFYYRLERQKIDAMRQKLANKLAAIPPRDRNILIARAKFSSSENDYNDIVQTMQDMVAEILIPDE